MFAVIETGGTQYKVAKGDTIVVNRLEGKEGSTVTIDTVLLINDKDTEIGTPYINNATVTGKIVDHHRGEKIRVFKMKAKKRYQKTQGHRQELTKLEITDIKQGAVKKSAAKKEEK